MKIVEKQIKFNKEILFQLSGNFVVSFVGSDNNFDFLKIKYSLNKDTPEIRISEEIVFIKDVGAKQDPDFNRFKSSVANKDGIINAVASFLSDAAKFANKLELNGNEIFVEVNMGIGSSDKSIIIKSDNLKVDFERVDFDGVEVVSGNLKINQGGLSSNALKIKSGNLKAKIFFNENNKEIKIKSANAKINADRCLGFDGFVSISGNNVKIDGIVNNCGDDVYGKFIAKLNNGNVKFIRGEGLYPALLK